MKMDVKFLGRTPPLPPKGLTSSGFPCWSLACTASDCSWDAIWSHLVASCDGQATWSAYQQLLAFWSQTFRAVQLGRNSWVRLAVEVMARALDFILRSVGGGKIPARFERVQYWLEDHQGNSWVWCCHSLQATNGKISNPNSSWITCLAILAWLTTRCNDQIWWRQTSRMTRL